MSGYRSRVILLKKAERRVRFMRFALIGCMVMNREISHLIAESPNIVRAWWLKQGLHDTPDILRGDARSFPLMG